jgi:hypothetical protein
MMRCKESEAPSEGASLPQSTDLFATLDHGQSFFKKAKITQYRHLQSTRSLKDAQVLMTVIERHSSKAKKPPFKKNPDTPPSSQEASSSTPILPDDSSSIEPAQSDSKRRNKPRLIVPEGADPFEYRRLLACESVRKYRENVKRDAERLARCKAQKRQSQRKYMESLRADRERYLELLRKREDRKQQQGDASSSVEPNWEDELIPGGETNPCNQDPTTTLTSQQ